MQNSFPWAFYWPDIAKLFLSQDQGHYYYDILGVDVVKEEDFLQPVSSRPKDECAHTRTGRKKGEKNFVFCLLGGNIVFAV